jgi:hypothetical protein
MDHTNCLQVAIKSIQSKRDKLDDTSPLVHMKWCEFTDVVSANVNVSVNPKS